MWVAGGSLVYLVSTLNMLAALAVDVFHEYIHIDDDNKVRIRIVNKRLASRVVTTYEECNQSINQSTDHSINQSINQSTNQPIKTFTNAIALCTSQSMYIWSRNVDTSFICNIYFKVDNTTLQWCLLQPTPYFYRCIFKTMGTIDKQMVCFHCVNVLTSILQYCLP